MRLRFSPDGAGQTLGCVLRGRVLGWYGARARRKSLPGRNRLGPCWGWDGGRLPRAGRVGGPSRCGSLTVREVSFGGVWPSSRVRYDEGGRSGRFRLGGLGLVQSRRDDDRGDVPFGDGRQDACNLRLWLEREELSHVLAIKRSEKLWAWTDKGLVR